MASHNEYGNFGEETATDYLREKGYTILDRHWRTGRKEVDIVAEKEGTLVFVEVKTRRLAWQCQPMDVLTPAKIRNIVMAADAYVRYKRLDMPVRYDLITVSGSTQNPHICHYEEAFYSPVWYR